MSLRLPGAKASDLGLRANGEDLLLDVNGRASYPRGIPSLHGCI